MVKFSKKEFLKIHYFFKVLFNFLTENVNLHLLLLEQTASNFVMWATGLKKRPLPFFSSAAQHHFLIDK